MVHVTISVSFYPAVPTSPSDFQSTYETCVSVTLQWQPGFDGGNEQTFTITYTDLDSALVYSVDDIKDTGQNVMQYKLTEADGITASRRFRFSITATNRIGTAHVTPEFDTATPGICTSQQMSMFNMY